MNTLSKLVIFNSLAFISPVAFATAPQSCHGPALARDAIRAVALISNRSMITDMVGGIGNDIWANYRHHGYSDHYRVIVDTNECRVLDLRLVATNQPVKEPN